MDFKQEKVGNKRAELQLWSRRSAKSSSLARDPSVGCSSRISYYRSTSQDHRGVPFQWELQPGTPKEAPKQETNINIIIPLSPPPAFLSLGLPKPCFDTNQETKPRNSRTSRIIMFWKNHVILKKHDRVLQEVSESYDHREFDDFYASDDDFYDFTASSSSSPPPFSNSHSRESSKAETPGADIFQRPSSGCVPLNFNSLFLCVSRRRL